MSLRPALRAVKAASVVNPVYVTLARPLVPDATQVPSVVVLNPTVFNQPIRNDILHLCVTHYRDSLRQGSANTKTRAEVAGSGRKLFRQKGSGRARVGDAQSPIRRGGGIVFGPKPRDFSTKLPRKLIDMGMRVALSTKLKESRLGVMKEIDWRSGKTGSLAKRLNVLGLGKVMFVTGVLPDGLKRATGNIPNVSAVSADQLNVFTLLQADRVMLDITAVEYLEDKLSKPVQLVDVPVLA